MNARLRKRPASIHLVYAGAVVSMLTSVLPACFWAADWMWGTVLIAAVLLLHSTFHLFCSLQPINKRNEP